MSKVYRQYDPDQILLMPPSLKDWLAPGHLAHFISDVIDTLDLSAITSVYEREERGFPPYHPIMMSKVLVYGYCVGITSSRRLAREVQEDVAFRMLAANNAPDFRTIADFRRRHLGALRSLFLQVLQLCDKAGLVKLGHVALDGTKIKASASKQRSMTYAEMKEQEGELQKKIDRYFEEAEQTDAKEDQLYGADKRGDELPEELRTAESRLRKIRELKAALEQEARAAAEERKKYIEECRAQTSRPGQRPKEFSPEPKPGKQRNLTDPDSRLLPSEGRFIQAYNCQAAVDDKRQVIVAADVHQEARDSLHAQEMVGQIVGNAGRKPKKITMDAGYFDSAVVKSMESQGLNVFVPPPDHKDLRQESIAGRMRAKLSTKTGRFTYLKRQCIVEPVFGQIKQGRGIRQFVLRGLEKVRCEWALICTGHNLLKLWRSLAPPGLRKRPLLAG